MSREEIVSQVKQFVLERFLPGENPSALTDSTPLISGGILDSLGTLELVSFLEEKFGFQLEAHEVDADRLNTLSLIAGLVESKATRAA